MNSRLCEYIMSRSRRAPTVLVSLQPVNSSRIVTLTRVTNERVATRSATGSTAGHQPVQVSSVPFSSCDVDAAEQHDSMSVFSCITRADPKLSGVF